MPTPNINTISAWVVSEYPNLPRIQTTNCRPIAGSTAWSQHAWANAADIFVSNSVGNELKPRLIERFGTHIKTILWQVTNHFDHIHLDTWPTGTGTPPCAGGVLKVKHKDGTIGTKFTDDIQGGDDMPLTESEMNTIAAKAADAVWAKQVNDFITGSNLRTDTLLRWARRSSYEQAQTSVPSAAEIAAELIKQLTN
jgi:hypothetical protein